MLEEISKNNEIIGSFRDCLKNRVTSPIYGIFLISWAVFHWELIYTAFFVSEQKIWEATGGMLKDEYLKQSFFDFSIFGKSPAQPMFRTTFSIFISLIGILFT